MTMKEFIKAEEIEFLIEIFEANLIKTKEFKEEYEKRGDEGFFMFELGKQRGLELAIRQLNKIMNE